MNSVTIYHWPDAPLSLRIQVNDLIPHDSVPMWLLWAPHKITPPPTCAGDMFIRGFLDLEIGEVFCHYTADGGEVRIGCVKKDLVNAARNFVRERRP